MLYNAFAAREWLEAGVAAAAAAAGIVSILGGRRQWGWLRPGTSDQIRIRSSCDAAQSLNAYWTSLKVSGWLFLTGGMAWLLNCIL